MAPSQEPVAPEPTPRPLDYYDYIDDDPGGADDPPDNNDKKPPYLN